MARVIWLDGSESVAPATAGGKGASLARLAAAGFRVPTAFVIPPELAGRFAPGGGEPDPEVADAIVSAARRLLPDGGRLAVRSSALDEDGEAASFAGQHATILEVEGDTALFAAIGACVASLDSEAAVSYRATREGARAEPRMAVVVQRMLAPDAAGVAFSIDPLTGDAGRVVVEAVRGLGEALVSGMAEADRLVVSRPALEVLGAHHPGEAVLAESEVREIARAAIAAEALFGAPQDIEFAIEGGTLWLLQSRPITTAPSAWRPEGGWVGEFDTPTSPDDYWTSANVQEVLPGVLTPLTMTLFARAAVVAYTVGYQKLKLLRKDEWPQFVGMFYNRAYLNIGATRMIADRALGSSGDAIEHRFLGGEYHGKVRTRHSRELWGFRLRSLIPATRMVLRIHGAADGIERRTLAMEARVRADDPERMSGPEIERRRAQLAAFVGDIFQVHLRASGMAGAGFDLVAGFVHPLLGDKTEATVPSLFSGMYGVESAQIGIDLWALSRIALEAHLDEAIRSGAFDPLDGALPAPWREAYAAFLERHGHRGLNEMEPAVPNWRADPASVVAIIASYLDQPPEKSPRATLERQRSERLRLTEDLARRMNPVKRALFRRTLGWAQGWVALRERTKSIIVRATRLVDYYVPTAGRMLAEAQATERPEDLFFLTDAQLTAFLNAPAAGHDFRGDVARRRKELERNRHIQLPERFHGHPVPIVPDLSHHAGEVLRGTPVSGGSVTGRARVIIDPRRDGPLQPGEILVAPVTDAGWTPLFALAAGLVVDMGSALSHGSTVAREYGLPAVVNVRTGTTHIRTGDLVALDGSAGTVTVLETNAAAP